jgi:hypothetical protein
VQWLGTTDPSVYFSVPSATKYQIEHDWPTVQLRCHELVEQAIQRINFLTGLPSIYPNGDPLFHQMAAAFLPKYLIFAIFNHLIDEFQIEIPCLD